MPTPTQATRQILLAIGAIISLTVMIVGAGNIASDTVSHRPVQATIGEGPHDRAVIHGCETEDACSIDYRNGRWHIQRGRF